jgi:hypothetical protein
MRTGWETVPSAAEQAVYVLSGFSESERKTIKLIADYLHEKGRKCFTYRGLRAYWDSRRMYDLEWHTVERNIRRLAELGWLSRRRRIFAKPRGGKRVVFCLTSNLEYMLRSLGWL